MTLGELEDKIAELKLSSPNPLQRDTSLMVFHKRNWIPLRDVDILLFVDEPTLVIST